MMNSCCDMNFFKEKMDKNEIPHKSSLPYLGIFSQYLFPLRCREENEILSLETSLAYSASSIESLTYEEDSENRFEVKNANSFYIGCLLKSKYDGIGNRKSFIDLVIVLDVSLSMSSSLNGGDKSCLSLALSAVRSIIPKLNAYDRLALVTFTDNAKVIFNLLFACELTERKIDNYLSTITANGSTVIEVGLISAMDILNRSKLKDNRQKRILLLTDMDDMNEDYKLVQTVKSASEYGIFITIIGIGFDLNTNLVEKVSKTKGFNYFSALKSEHLDKIIVESFDFNFFPIAYDVNLSFESGDLEISKIYGTNFDNKLLELASEWKTSNHWLKESSLKYNVEFILLYTNRILKPKNRRLPMAVISNIIKYLSHEKFVKNICEISTCYPSSDIIENHHQDYKDFKYEVKGKFFLIKCKLKNPISYQITAKFTIDYIYTNGKKFNQSFLTNHKVEYLNKIYIEPAISNGLCLFYYAKFMRKMMNAYEKISWNNNELKEKSEDFLKKENLERLSKAIIKFIQKFWKKHNDLKTDLNDNIHKTIKNILENIEERKRKDLSDGYYEQYSEDDYIEF